MSDLTVLRAKSYRILRLPDQAQQTVDAYLRIKVGDAVAACTYHINPGISSMNRGLLGKGSPREIEAIAQKYFEKYDIHPNGDAEALRSLLSACGIGIDCSGFASWVLNEVTRATLGRPIWKCLRFPGLRRGAVSKIRPIENISADLLTGHLNSTPVGNLSRIKPGDLIRVAGWHHVLIVTEVGIDTKGLAMYFEYAQSSCMYEQASGVRLGHAVIQEPEEPLIKQAWFDEYDEKVIQTFIGNGSDSRAVRLKVLA